KPRRDFVRTALHRAETTDIGAVRAIFAAMMAEATAYFGAEQGIGVRRLSADYRIELRYHGQEHPVSVPADPATAAVSGLPESFHAAHERAYTFRLADTPVEFVHFHLSVEADAVRPGLTPINGDGRTAGKALKGRRQVIDADRGPCDTPVYDRDLLPAG